MYKHLCRGKRTETGDWVEGFYSKSPSGKVYITATVAGHASPCTVDPDTVGLCSGIPDNCGKFMYEGDLIRMNGNPLDLAVVEFGEFTCVSIDPEEKVDKVTGWHYRPLPTDVLSQVEPFCWEFQLNSMWVKECDIRVIGKIYDHPEFLGGAK